MTCIVGLAHRGGVIIGGDSAGVDSNYILIERADRKVFRTADFVMGFTSSFRMGQLLAHTFRPPSRDTANVYAYMVTDFVGAVRDCLKAGGFARKNDEAETGGTFIVGYAGRLFTIHDDYQVAESADNYAACGCGERFALGALFASSEHDPEARVRRALEAAQKFCSGVRGPFHLETLES